MNSKREKDKLTKDQIDQCISILEALNNDTDQIFDIPIEQRIELLTQAGRLSRPQKDELRKRIKGARKKVKKQTAQDDKYARNKTGIRSAREAVVFVAPKMLELDGEKTRRATKTVAPREC